MLKPCKPCCHLPYLLRLLQGLQVVLWQLQLQVVALPCACTHTAANPGSCSCGRASGCASDEGLDNRG